MIRIENLRIAYGHREALHGISFAVRRREIFGIIGPAQSGKTTLLKALNRTLDLVSGATVTGDIWIGGETSICVDGRLNV